MRLKYILAALAGVFALGFLVPDSAEAFGWHRGHPPKGWGRAQTVRHWVYYPRYRHHYHTHPATDPYAYRYRKPRYYPYYNSGYWRSAREMRKRRRYYAQPRYYSAWGYSKPGYRALRHRRWHHHRRW